MLCRITYELEGTVQGVGFRPSVYRLATEAGLGGWIQNRSGKVMLCLEGSKLDIGQFMVTLHQNLPVQAKLTHIHTVSKEVISEDPDAQHAISPFEIIESQADSQKQVSIPADLAMCRDCEQEISTPGDRRYGYPFTTCTACGPRYTVVNDMPYDRERTTLADFPLCPKCQEEYDAPENRRFHAESTACPACGPKLQLLDTAGKTIAGESPLLLTRQALADGRIVAIRGIGGFLLCCDALNRSAIGELRQRKDRPDKPFAVMARSAEDIFKHCQFSAHAVKALMSPAAPICIMDTSPTTSLPLDLLSPDTDTLGVMLPYSPLHKLLFEPLTGDSVPPFEMLVMTSGNRGGEPICLNTAEAIDRLAGIADLILTHDREINLRNDDSLCVIQQGEPQIWRRARGYAPNPVRLNAALANTVLAMGGELKNTIALGYAQQVVISPHIGDLESPEAIDGLRQVVECFPRFLEKTPDIIAVDLHPDMHSTRIGRKLAALASIPVIGVQHHHAHAAAAMAEHGLSQCLAVSFDGTGYGPDGKIWGAELMSCHGPEYHRMATFAPASLPGGDAAVKHPKRQLVARLIHSGIPLDESWLKHLELDDTTIAVWTRQIEKQLNTPLSHSAGRLFDAFSALIGVAPDPVTYEGQAAIRLEAIAKRATETDSKLEHSFCLSEQDGMLVIDWTRLFENFATPDTCPDSPAEAASLALAFHQQVAAAATAMVEYGIDNGAPEHIVLTGGVFMNRLLTELVVAALEPKGLKVHLHRNIPPNDGCISLGQAFIVGQERN